MSKYYNNLAIIDNQYDGQVFSGNAISLNEEGDTGQSIVYPKAHTLTPLTQEPMSASCSGGDMVISNATPTSIDIVITIPADYSNSPRIYFFTDGLNIIEGDYCEITFDVNVISGTFVPGTQIALFGLNTPISKISPEKYKATGLAGTVLNYCRLDTNGKDFSYDIQITNAKIVKISSNSSFISYHDIATRTRVQSDVSTPISTTHTLTTSHADYCTHTKALTANELIEINDGENVLSQVYYNNRVLVDGFKASDMVNYAMGNEGGLNGNNVYDIITSTDIPIVVNGGINTFTKYKNTNDGNQNLELLQDVLGKTIGIASVDTAQFSNFDGRKIKTNIFPSFDNYTLVETVYGLLEDLDTNGISLGTQSQRTEVRTYVSDTINGDAYYIDGVQQGYVPTKPDSNTYIELDGVAKVGYIDTLDAESAEFRYYTSAKTATEIGNIYDEIAATHYSLIDDVGNTLIDDVGNTLIDI